VVGSENEQSWKWFFINLRQACGVRERQCIVSDRHEAIVQGLNHVFPDVMHGSCTYHVLKNIKNKFRKKGVEVKKVYNRACRAYTTEEFNRHMDELDSIDPRIRKYMEEEVFLEKCTRLYGNVSRYSTMTSNTAESINNAIKGIRDLPITSLIESIRCMV
jgi:transposase-like protein